MMKGQFCAYHYEMHNQRSVKFFFFALVFSLCMKFNAFYIILEGTEGGECIENLSSDQVFRR